MKKLIKNNILGKIRELSAVYLPKAPKQNNVYSVTKKVTL